MWSGGQEENNDGEAVLLMQPMPVASSKRRSKVKANNEIEYNTPTRCYIGGRPSFYPNDDVLLNGHIFCSKQGEKMNRDKKTEQQKVMRCKNCGKALLLVSQIYAPIDGVERTLYIFGCNSHLCLKKQDNNDIGGSKEDNVRFYEGGTVFRCIRSQSKIKEKEMGTQIAQETYDDSDNLAQSENIHDEGEGWGDSNDDDGGWGLDDDSIGADDVNIKSMEELEAMLTACELDKTPTNLKSAGKIPNSTKHDERTDVQELNKKESYAFPASFPQYELELFDEPYATKGRKTRSPDEDSDSDDENLGNDLSVQSMLSRYLEEDKELDPELMKLLKLNAPINKTDPSNSSKTFEECEGKGKSHLQKGGEKYERLPPDQRALFAFTDRIKRAPEQVLRYAYDGEPLWSAPTTLTIKNEGTNKNNRGRKKKTSTISTISLLPEIPPCICGAKRTFECQLLPSILHILNVDENENPANIKNILNEHGGMNWGVIAVYSCMDSCDESREEFLVLQGSVDDIPSFHAKQRNRKNEEDSDVEHETNFHVDQQMT